MIRLKPNSLIAPFALMTNSISSVVNVSLFRSLLGIILCHIDMMLTVKLRGKSIKKIVDLSLKRLKSSKFK